MNFLKIKIHTKDSQAVNQNHTDKKLILNF